MLDETSLESTNILLLHWLSILKSGTIMFLALLLTTSLDNAPSDEFCISQRHLSLHPAVDVRHVTSTWYSLFQMCLLRDSSRFPKETGVDRTRRHCSVETIRGTGPSELGWSRPMSKNPLERAWPRWDQRRLSNRREQILHFDLSRKGREAITCRLLGCAQHLFGLNTSFVIITTRNFHMIYFYTWLCNYCNSMHRLHVGGD